MLPVIALVGRPNVGKSTLFNRLTKTRDALVASFPGLTRDRQYGRGALGEFDYLVVDTGGLSGDESGIDKPMAEQSHQAVAEADLVLLLVDAKEGRMGVDEDIAGLLRQQEKPVLLVANKIDGQNPDYIIGEFASLGLGEPVAVSATNGHGIGQLVNTYIAAELAQLEKPEEPEMEAHGIKLAVVGRPNVGKSTLVNRMLGEDRVVVFDEAGTTRDSIYIPYERDGQAYTIIDTAGVRRRGKVVEAVEKFSVIKTLDAVNDANVVILMVDAREAIVDQDLHLLGHVIEAGRALVIAVNKWDGTDLEQKQYIKQELERRLTFLDFASIHFISALHGSGVGKLYHSVLQSYASATRPISTASLNTILSNALQAHQPPLVKGRRIKLRYAHAGGSNPPIIVIHGNQTDSIPESYKRFLRNHFHKALNLKGTPLRIEFRTGDNPFKGRKNKLTQRQISRKRRLMAHVKKNEKKRRHS
ncbi:MAG: ribosome biogenesis GTPase Der [Pseudomonadota bacterium]|jgi:GTP-binding protein|nr:ribosome biogenesis GTPase Der [Pseudomonadota bacterium]